MQFPIVLFVSSFHFFVFISTSQLAEKYNKSQSLFVFHLTTVIGSNDTRNELNQAISMVCSAIPDFNGEDIHKIFRAYRKAAIKCCRF